MRISDWSSDVCSSDLLDGMRRRLARALAAPEAQPQRWEEAFYRALQHACPGGRIMANAGAEHLKANASTINCTVSQTLDDSMAGIMRADRKSTRLNSSH